MERTQQLVALLRQLLLFLLGVAVILDAVVNSDTPIAQLIVGLVLLGLVSVDTFLGTLPWNRQGRRGP